MSWARLDDDIFDNPKIAALSDAAQLAHIKAIVYSAKALTDGDVPLRKAREFASPKVIKELVPGLWEPTEAGFRVHDYLEYNPNRASVLAEREKAKQRMFGKRSGEHPANKGRTSPSPDPVPDPLLVETPYVTTQESDPLRKPTNVLDRTFGQGSDREDLERALDEEWKLDYLKEHPEGIRMTPEEIKRGRIDLRARRKGSAAAVG